MINVYNNYGEISFDFQKIINDLERGLSTLMNLSAEVDISLILVNNDEITQINKNYRDKDYPTDVISFEDHDEENYLGDIFISIDKVFEQADAYKHSPKREFAFLLCHGCLHLLGYDHLTTEEETLMFAKQEEILTYINYTRDMK